MLHAAALREKGQLGYFDDFISYTDTQVWTKTIGAGAAVAIVANTAGGVLQLTTGGTQNIASNIAFTNANFKLAVGRNFYGECLLQYAEVSTNQAAVAFGFSSVVTSVMLQDTTGTPATSFSGALIYKQAGDTVWRAIASNVTTQTLTTGTQSSQPSPTTQYQNLAIEGRDVDGTNYEITYFINDQPLLDSSAHRPVVHTVAIASISAMKPVIFLKNPGGASSEILNVDYVFVGQRRKSPTNI